MLEQLKTDRIAQIMLAGVIVAACFACFGVSAFAFFVINRQQDTIIQPTVAQTQPTATPQTSSTPTPSGPTPTPIVLKFEGKGDKVVFFDAPRNGPALFGFAHRGDGNFIVKLLAADGELIDLLVNDIDNYDGEKTHRLDAGSYMLEITAEGDWLAVILPPQEYY